MKKSELRTNIEKILKIDHPVHIYVDKNKSNRRIKYPDTKATTEQLAEIEKLPNVISAKNFKTSSYHARIRGLQFDCVAIYISKKISEC